MDKKRIVSIVLIVLLIVSGIAIYYVNNDNKKETEITLSTEQIADRIIGYYDSNYPAKGSYVIFDNETMETTQYYEFSVRYQISDEELKELGPEAMPSANRLVANVKVDKKSGLATTSNLGTSEGVTWYIEQ